MRRAKASASSGASGTGNSAKHSTPNGNKQHRADKSASSKTTKKDHLTPVRVSNRFTIWDFKCTAHLFYNKLPGHLGLYESNI